MVLTSKSLRRQILRHGYLEKLRDVTTGEYYDYRDIYRIKKEKGIVTTNHYEKRVKSRYPFKLKTAKRRAYKKMMTGKVWSRESYKYNLIDSYGYFHAFTIDNGNIIMITLIKPLDLY